MLDAGATSMKSPCAVNLHNAVTVSQQHLGKRVIQLSPARMNEVCNVLRFSLGYELVNPRISLSSSELPHSSQNRA